jgi:cysteine synthase
LAFIASELGYPALVFLPSELPVRRIQWVESLLPRDTLSRVIVTRTGSYVAGMVKELRHFLSRHGDEYRGRKIYFLNHSRRREAVFAMERLVGGVLDRQALEREVDFGVAALGNGTSAMGLLHAIKERNGNAKLVGVEPAEAPWFYRKKYSAALLSSREGIASGYSRHALFGAGAWGVDFPNMDLTVVDEVRLVREEQWRPVLEVLHRRGLKVGNTSAACEFVVNVHSQATGREGATYLSMFYDSGERY